MNGNERLAQFQQRLLYCSRQLEPEFSFHQFIVEYKIRYNEEIPYEELQFPLDAMLANLGILRRTSNGNFRVVEAVGRGGTTIRSQLLSIVKGLRSVVEGLGHPLDSQDIANHFMLPYPDVHLRFGLSDFNSFLKSFPELHDLNYVQLIPLPPNAYGSETTRFIRKQVLRVARYLPRPFKAWELANIFKGLFNLTQIHSHFGHKVLADFLKTFPELRHVKAGVFELNSNYRPNVSLIPLPPLPPPPPPGPPPPPPPPPPPVCEEFQAGSTQKRTTDQNANAVSFPEARLKRKSSGNVPGRAEPTKRVKVEEPEVTQFTEEMKEGLQKVKIEGEENAADAPQVVLEVLAPAAGTSTSGQPERPPRRSGARIYVDISTNRTRKTPAAAAEPITSASEGNPVTQTSEAAPETPPTEASDSGRKWPALQPPAETPKIFYGPEPPPLPPFDVFLLNVLQKDKRIKQPFTRRGLEKHLQKNYPVYAFFDRSFLASFFESPHSQIVSTGDGEYCTKSNHEDDANNVMKQKESGEKSNTAEPAQRENPHEEDDDEITVIAHIRAKSPPAPQDPISFSEAVARLAQLQPVVPAASGIETAHSNGPTRPEFIIASNQISPLNQLPPTGYFQQWMRNRTNPGQPPSPSEYPFLHSVILSMASRLRQPFYPDTLILSIRDWCMIPKIHMEFGFSNSNRFLGIFEKLYQDRGMFSVFQKASKQKTKKAKTTPKQVEAKKNKKKKDRPALKERLRKRHQVGDDAPAKIKLHVVRTARHLEQPFTVSQFGAQFRKMPNVKKAYKKLCFDALGKYLQEYPEFLSNGKGKYYLNSFYAIGGLDKMPEGAPIEVQDDPLPVQPDTEIVVPVIPNGECPSATNDPLGSAEPAVDLNSSVEDGEIVDSDVEQVSEKLQAKMKFYVVRTAHHLEQPFTSTQFAMQMGKHVNMRQAPKKFGFDDLEKYLNGCPVLLSDGNGKFYLNSFYAVGGLIKMPKGAPIEVQDDRLPQQPDTEIVVPAIPSQKCPSQANNLFGSAEPAVDLNSSVEDGEIVDSDVEHVGTAISDAVSSGGEGCASCNEITPVKPIVEGVEEWHDVADGEQPVEMDAEQPVEVETPAAEEQEQTAKEIFPSPAAPDVPQSEAVDSEPLEKKLVSVTSTRPPVPSEIFRPKHAYFGQFVASLLDEAAGRGEDTDEMSHQIMEFLLKKKT